jgi:hypothetical protein
MPSKLTWIEDAQRWGIPGAIGAALAVGALAFLLFAVLPSRQELERTQTALQQAAERKARPQRPGEDKVQAPQDALKAFYDSFPKESNAADALQQIYDAAKQNGIELPHGAYTMELDGKAGLVRYRITFPVTGSYQNIRGFINAALAALPTLALEHVDFQRQKVGDPLLEAKIRLSLLLLKQ